MALAKTASGRNAQVISFKETGTMDDDKKTLLEILVRKSFQFSKEPKFPLASGKISQYYVDCKMTTLCSRSQYLIGKIFFDMISELNIQGIGGLTLGADPIAIATSVIAGQKDIKLTSFIIRKDPKKHGLMKWIEGNIQTGDRVVIIDDVVTTGGSVIKAVKKAEEAGLKIVKVFVLVDREEGGSDIIKEKGYDFEALFTKAELLEVHEKLIR